MGRKRTPGLTKRGGVWHIDKTIHGKRVRQSCKTSSLKEAESYLAKLTEEIRLAEFYGTRPDVSFEQAAIKYVEDHGHKKSLRNDLQRLRQLMPWIGSIPIRQIHRGTLEPWIESRIREGRAPGTINHGIKLVNRILRLASDEWINDFGLTWLERPHIIRLLPNEHRREPYPLSWEEQDRLFGELPLHLLEMSLFAVNTGCRDQEVCHLRWDWEVKVPELNTFVFIVPGHFTKNGDKRLVVLNRVAKSVVESCRNRHSERVFTYKGKPTGRMMNKAWLRARKASNLPQVRVHDLKHTYGRRLRAAGVSFEDRQDLLGHRSNRVTTHYSAPELAHLIEASDFVCERNSRKPELVVLKRSG